MKWLALFILSCIQAEWVSSCVFDKVENVQGTLDQVLFKDESGCFAACYGDNNCIAFAYRDIKGMCYLYKAGANSIDHPCISGNVCYILHRDEEDSMCARYVNFEKRP